MDANSWRGSSYGTSPDQLHNAAHDYIGQCYAVGLEVIGITDHNYASMDFIPYLRRAISDISSLYGYEIVLFPGFELNADVGKGLHCLALFNPDTELSEIDHALTSCGVSPPRFHPAGQATRSTKRLPEILREVQQRRSDGQLRGIVICPHSQSQAGIFDNDAISEWLQQMEFLNPELLCIEVPKPPSEMNSNWQRLLSAGADCDHAWRRQRSIACIMSSDAKSLRRDECENFIGFRYTWIKMSNPSIEALRQAFLDHESRIRLCHERPEDHHATSRVASISVKNAAFLADQAVVFSRNLNAIIGGRGTGKSTFVEYLRIGLAQETSVGRSEGSGNLKKLRGSLLDTSTIDIVIEKEGASWTLRSVGGASPTVIAGDALAQIARFFPVRVFSQREIFEIAESASARRQLVEDLARAKLDELARMEQDVVRRIRQINQRLQEFTQLEERSRELQTEITDLEVRIRRVEGVMEPLSAWERCSDQKAYFDDLRERSHEVTAQVAGLELEDVAGEIEATLLEGPYDDVLTDGARILNAALRDFRAAIQSSSEAFALTIGNFFQSPRFKAWEESYAAEKANAESIKESLREQGVDPERYLSYRSDLKERNDQLIQVQQEIGALQTLRLERDGSPDDPDSGLMVKLLALWQGQSEVRSEAAARLTEALPQTSNGDPFLNIEVHAWGDEAAFLAAMRKHLKDRRRISEEDWDVLMQAVFAEARRQGIPPTELLVKELSDLGSAGVPVSTVFPTARYLEVLLTWLRPLIFPELRLWRTPDRVSVELFRQDGSRVGELDGPELSIGQRCTAVLAMLLASDDVPVVIDQPEEDLDNEFIYRELVPLLRRIKERRQIILVSHNANIPVNGDAELIAALEVRNGRGVQKSMGGQLAVGALDQRAVQVAVEEIMEGSEEAFRRRYEKYGF